ncbi:translation initiation factor 2, alpha subunit [Phyllosticta citrichinensis]
MMLLSELSRRRIRSINKLIRLGQELPAVVLRVDKEKGYIDLSKRRVTMEDAEACQLRYNKSKKIHSIMRHVAEKTHTPIEDLYKHIGWPLDKKYGHSIDAFKLSITNTEVWNEVTFPNEAVKLELQSYIFERLAPQPTQIRADIEVTCFSYEGIDAIKEALRTAEALSTDEIKVRVKLVSSPLYVITTTCLNPDAGVSIIQAGIDAITTSIRRVGGDCHVKMAPKAVTESDDAELQALMESRERENQQVSGDEDDSESDQGVIVE